MSDSLVNPFRTVHTRDVCTAAIRVAYVCGDFPLFTGGRSGGIGAHTYNLARAVAALGHDVSVIANASKAQSFRDGGVAVHGFPISRRQWKLGRVLPMNWIRWSLVAYAALRRLHASRAFDLVVFPDAYGEGFRFALSPFVPFVVRFGGPASVYQRWDDRHVPRLRARVEELLERFPAQRASLLVCSSRPFVEYISREWSLDSSRFRFVRNPLDIERFRPPPTEASRSHPVVLFAGHVQQLKGTGDLVEAIPEIVRNVPGVQFKIVGNDTKSGPARASYRGVLEGRLRTLGHYDRVEFVDTIPQDQLIAIYQDCDVFCLPCRNDVYPNAVLEAMGCARPCIVTSTTGVAELIERSDCGAVVPPRAPQALAEAVVRLLRLPREARRAMGERARRTVEELNAPSVIGRHATDVYRELLGRGGSDWATAKVGHRS